MDNEFLFSESVLSIFREQFPVSLPALLEYKYPKLLVKVIQSGAHPSPGVQLWNFSNLYLHTIAEVAVSCGELIREVEISLNDLIYPAFDPALYLNLSKRYAQKLRRVESQLPQFPHFPHRPHILPQAE